jgi:hypothetical protein
MVRSSSNAKSFFAKWFCDHSANCWIAARITCARNDGREHQSLFLSFYRIKQIKAFCLRSSGCSLLAEALCEGWMQTGGRVMPIKVKQDACVHGAEWSQNHFAKRLKDAIISKNYFISAQ